MDEGWEFNEYDRLWPGWSVESMGDDYEWQARLTGRKLRDWQYDTDECRRTFRRMIEIRERDFGKENRPPFADTVMTHIDRLAHGKPLPPARFVNRHGRIITPTTTTN